MFLAEKTVKNYVSNLLAKLGMERRTQAATFAARLNERIDPGRADPTPPAPEGRSDRPVRQRPSEPAPVSGPTDDAAVGQGALAAGPAHVDGCSKRLGSVSMPNTAGQREAAPRRSRSAKPSEAESVIRRRRPRHARCELARGSAGAPRRPARSVRPTPCGRARLEGASSKLGVHRHRPAPSTSAGHRPSPQHEGFRASTRQGQMSQRTFLFHIRRVGVAATLTDKPDVNARMRAATWKRRREGSRTRRVRRPRNWKMATEGGGRHSPSTFVWEEEGVPVIVLTALQRG